MQIDWGEIENYECYHKLGRGKYSEVFLGYCKSNNQKTVIKVLKPVKAEKIYREIKILQTLYGGPNIIEGCDTTKEPEFNSTESEQESLDELGCHSNSTTLG